MKKLDLVLKALMKINRDIKEIKEDVKVTAEAVDLLIEIQSKNLKRN